MAGEPDQNRPTSSETGPPDGAHTLTRRVRRHAIAAGAGGLLGIVAITGMAAAQTVGDSVCDGPIGSLMAEGVPMILGIVILGGVAVTAAAHGASGFFKNPEKSTKYKQWRNNAAMGAVGAIPLAWLMVEFLSLIGIGIAECANPIPFF